MKIRLLFWARFRGYSHFETWPLDHGRSFNLTIALRPNAHSWLNWYWCLEVTYPRNILRPLRLAALGLLLLLAGCSSLHPIVQAGHSSHALQHMREHPQNHGYDTVGAGIRYRRGGLAIDVTENYSPDELDGQHEVFEARITYEVK